MKLETWEDKKQPTDWLKENVCTQEERKIRTDICDNCDKLKLGTVCSKCSCVMSLKTWLTFANCPLGKWRSIKRK